MAKKRKSYDEWMKETYGATNDYVEKVSAIRAKKATVEDDIAPTKEEKAINAFRSLAKFGAYSKIGADTFTDDWTSSADSINSIYGGWQDKKTLASTKEKAASMYERLNAYQKYAEKYGDKSVDVSESINAYKRFLDEYDYISAKYGNYATADDFLKSGDKISTLDAYDYRIAKLEEALKAHQKTKSHNPRTDIRLAEEEDKIKSQLTQLKAERKSYENSEKISEWSSVADPKSKNYDPEFAKKSKYVENKLPLGQTKEIGAYSGRIALRSQYDDFKYAYINDNNIVNEQSKTYAAQQTSVVDEKNYEYMTAEEVALYNYYYATGGSKKGDEYLDLIQETLNRRAGEAIAAKKDTTAEKLLYSVNAGLDQFKSGLHGIFTSKDLPTTDTQFASAIIREDLEDVGPDIFGHSLGSIVYDAGTTLTNMAPSIATAALANVVAPGAGTYVGAGLLGTSAAGNAYQSKLDEGWDDGKARAFGILTGVSEAALSTTVSKVFGGKLPSKVSAAIDGIDNGLARFAANYGHAFASEGLEEAAQEILTPLFENIALGYNENGFEDINWSDVAYNGLLGGMSGGMFETVNVAANAVAKDKLSVNEQKVFDKIYDDAIAAAEKGGETLSKKEKSEIYNEVMENLKNGYVPTDKIEEILGGDNYKAYKDALDNENALQEEFNTLNKMKQGDMTGEQIDRRAELKQQLEDLKNSSDKDGLKTKLSDDVLNQIFGEAVNLKHRNSYLIESYTEQEKRGTAFNADLSKVEEKYQATYKNAIESGILNDSRITHKMVDFIAKISADKGVDFNFTNNERIKNSSFAVEGAIVNGYKTTNADGETGITINIESPKYINTIVGHEITHIFEGTELYGALQNTITEYAKSKGDYDGRIEALKKLYKPEEVDTELVADLVGDYLFTDKDFIRKLSVEHRNVFQKVYDEIKYLCKVATAGSKEARQLEKVKKTFAEVYRESGKAKAGENAAKNPDISFSLSEPVEETKDLVAVHNLSEEKLSKSLKLGGLPMPSIAIARAKDGYTDFGKISLVFNKETIDPQFMRSNKVYSGDAWTPTYPRVEYEVSDKAQAKIEEKINSLVPEEVIRDLGGLHIDSYNLESELNRHSGSIVEAFRYNTALKYAFLVESGENLELPTKNKRLARYSNHPDEAIIRVAETVSKEKLQGILREYTAEQVHEVEPEIRNAVNEYFQEKYKKLPQKALEALLKKDALSRGDIDDYAREALDYLKNGVEQEVDYSSAKTLIDEAIDTQKYESWVKDLFANIVQNEGIRNNKDLFTPAGNRRSFKALHYEHNLENVIRAMKEDGEKGIGWGSGGLFGASTTEFSSIDDIKRSAEERITAIPEEEFSAIKKEFSNRFFELANSLPIHKESFTATDDAANMLTEAVSKFKTKSGMANYIRRESQGWANYSDNVVEELIELVNDIRNMPTQYFEAKPQRAVGFDEVATAIIPDNASDELKQMLADKGIKFVEYESGNEQARLEVLNSLEDAKFSLSENGEKPAKYGNYNISGKDIALPVQESIIESVPTEDVAEDVAPTETIAENTTVEQGNFVDVVRVGDFYEIRGEAANRVAEDLELQIVHKTINGERVPIVGFPVRYLETYNKKANEKGFSLRNDPTEKVEPLLPVDEPIVEVDEEIAPTEEKNNSTLPNFAENQIAHYKMSIAEERANIKGNRKTSNAALKRYISQKPAKRLDGKIDAATQGAIISNGKQYMSHNGRFIVELNTPDESIPTNDKLNLGSIQRVIEMANKNAIEGNYEIDAREISLIRKEAPKGNFNLVNVDGNCFDINYVDAVLKAIDNPTISLSNLAGNHQMLVVKGSNGQAYVAPVNISGKNLEDVNFVYEAAKVVEETAPMQDALPDDFAPITEDEANAIARETLETLDDADAPPVEDNEYYDLPDTTRLDEKALKNISKSLKETLFLDRNETKAIQDVVQKYSTTEFPSEEALFDEIKKQFGEKVWKQRNEQVAEVKAELRKYRIKPLKYSRSDIGDYSAFQREHFGKIRFSNEGLPVDVAYMELSEMYPDFFPDNIVTQSDQMLAIAEVADMSIDTEMRDMLDDDTIQEAVNIITAEVNNYKQAETMAEAEHSARDYLHDIAPLKQPKAEKAYEAIRPKAEKPNVAKEPKLIRVKDADTAQHTAEVLTEEPKVEKQKNKGWSKFVANFVDKGAVFEKLAKKKGNRAVDDKYNFMRYSEGRAQNLIGKGADGVKSLNDIRTEVEVTGKTKEFYDYLYHKHNVDRMSLEGRYDDVENKPVFGYTVTAEASQEIVNKYESTEPRFKQYANDVYAYLGYLRQQLVDNGVISQETADLWSKMYPHYVPIRRLGDAGLNINVPLDSNKTGINAPVKRATGGSRDILPLFDTMAQRTMQTYKATAKNSFGVELKNTLGTVIESQKAGIDEVIDSVDAHEELLQEGKDGRSPTFTVFENGERVTFEITEEMYDALKPTGKGLSYTNKALNKASNFHRGVLTEYNPVFLLTNAVKDAQDVFINSQHPAHTYANVPQAIAQLLVKKGRYYNEYIKNGGEQNTYFDKQSNTFKEKSALRKIVGFPLDMIASANNFIERIPRLAEYMASRKAGRSVEGAMLDSARVTTNFAAGGDVTKFLNRNGVTFLNASVQGAVQQVRNVREAKARGFRGWVHLAAKYSMAGLAPALLNHLLWDDDDDYAELSDYVKDNYYIVGKMNNGQFVRIPKGRAVSVIQEAFEQVSNALTGNDEVDLKNFLDLAMTNLAPNNPIDNNILAPIMQVKNNETWYGEDLVPTRLQDLPAAEQYDESTDSISRWLGETLNVSPYKINYLLNQYSGGVGDVVLPMLTPEAERGDNSLSGNIIAPLKDKFTTDAVMNNQNVSNFYDTVDELTKNAKSSYATDEDILKYKYINSVNADLGELYAKKREIQNGSLSDQEKYSAVRELQKEINALAKDSLNTYNNVSIQDGYATVGDLHYRVNKDGEWEKVTDKQLEKQEKVTSGLGISASEYWSNKDEYDYAYESPEKYAVAKSVGGYNAFKSYSSELYDIKADKDENGDSIRGSRKEKVVDYINNLDAEYGARIILFKSEYPADDTYNYDIVEYLNSRDDISYEEMETILKELGFTVKSDGTITW